MGASDVHHGRVPAPGRRKPALGCAWGFDDPEMRRRRRVAAYKAYKVEGKVKASIRSGVRWIKIKCSRIVRGF